MTNSEEEYSSINTRKASLLRIGESVALSGTIVSYSDMTKMTEISKMAFKPIHLEPKNIVFSDIMGNRKSYEIPSFQRDYSWEEEQLNELWQDIEQMLDTKIQHFMGYLVFQTTNNKIFEVIDGQQRLTTISLFILAALYCFSRKIDQEEDKQKNDQRKNYYHGNYMGVLDTVTLRTSPKLTLNRHNKEHFQSMINEYGVPRQRNITNTNRKLNKAFEFFTKKLESLELSGDKIADLVDSVCDGLIFTTITVKDDLHAYIVFETLNARGVRLSAPDLFKNYLLSTMAKSKMFSEKHFDDFEDRWAKIISQLGETRFTAFLRSYVGMHDRLPNKKDLYRNLKKQVGEPVKVMPYLIQIEKNSPVYAALQNPEDSFWNEYGNGRYRDAKSYLETLDIFNVKTPLSLLMVAYDCYRDTPENFITILKWISTISIRYNVICQKQPNTQELKYNEIANQLHKDRGLCPNNIKPFLKPIYPEDNEFCGAFRDKQMLSKRSSKKIMFLLGTIERHASNGNAPPQNLTLEHVLPYEPDDNWKEYFGNVTYNDAIDRLGNMAILPRNQNMAQETYSEKRKTLRESNCSINRKIAEYPEWNIDSLNDYQGWLARQATAVWKINGL